MSKVIETQTVPQRQIEVIVGTRCDCCHDVTSAKGHWPDGDWQESPQSHLEVAVSKRLVYTNGREYDVETSWDLCPKCFDEHVRPLLERITGPEGARYRPNHAVLGE